MKLGVLGAGLVGGYLGGRLAAAGSEVVFVARERVRAEWEVHGLRLTDVEGHESQVAPERLNVVEGASALADCDVVLVTVKSGQTAAAASQLRSLLRPDALAVSFQNGVQNADILRRALGDRVLRAVVPFNVVSPAPGHLHQGTNGPLVLEADGREQRLLQALLAAKLSARGEARILDFQWGKLLLNLNNSINALAGIPLRAELELRGYRQVFAACIEEGLDALRAAGVRPCADLAVPLGLIPKVLRLPTPLFRVIARSMIRMDPSARSSMLEDLSAGRPTEIDALNGAIVELARRLNRQAPINEAIVRAVHQAEGRGSPELRADQLQEALAMGHTNRGLVSLGPPPCVA